MFAEIGCDLPDVSRRVAATLREDAPDHTHERRLICSGLLRLSSRSISLALTLLLAGCASSSEIESNFVCLRSVSCGLRFKTKTVWSRAELESDLDAWLDWTRSTHPAFEQSVDLSAFEQELKQVRLDLRNGMDTSDAWYAFARLNPLLNDAHLGLELPAIDSDLEPWRVEIENAHAFVPAPGPEGGASGDRLCRWRFCAGDDRAYFACCPR
jgi:hypothetical protein